MGPLPSGSREGCWCRHMPASVFTCSSALMSSLHIYFPRVCQVKQHCGCPFPHNLQDRLFAAINAATLFKGPSAASIRLVRTCKAIAEGWYNCYMQASAYVLV